MSRPAEAAVTLTPTATAWLQPLGITRDETHIYHLTDGHVFPISTTGLISAVTKTSTQMEAIMASKHIWQPRGDLVHLALEVMAHQRWNPSPPPDLQPPEPGDYEPWVKPLLNHPLWNQVQVVGAEVMAYSLRRNVAGTADLVLKLPDGTYAIADLKTQGSKSASAYDTKPQLGAGVEMIGDHYGLLFSRCLTLWSRPGSLTIETHTADECLQAWLDVCEIYAERFRPF